VLPPCRIVIAPPAVPPAVEMLAIIPLISVKLSVILTKLPAVKSTIPPLPEVDPWALIVAICTLPTALIVTLPPDAPLVLILPVLMLALLSVNAPPAAVLELVFKAAALALILPVVLVIVIG